MISFFLVSRGDWIIEGIVRQKQSDLHCTWWLTTCAYFAFLSNMLVITIFHCHYDFLSQFWFFNHQSTAAMEFVRVNRSIHGWGQIHWPSIPSRQSIHHRPRLVLQDPPPSTPACQLWACLLPWACLHPNWYHHTHVARKEGRTGPPSATNCVIPTSEVCWQPRQAPCHNNPAIP